MTKKRQKNGKSDENHDLDINHDVDKQLDESIDVADENQEINELKDKLLRSRAELENFKKRHETGSMRTLVLNPFLSTFGSQGWMYLVGVRVRLAVGVCG